MSYYDAPRYWFIGREFLLLHPHIQQLIWPQGFTNPGEYLGNFYHVSHLHPNGAFINVFMLAQDQQVKYIRGRTEMYFPTWRVEKNQPQAVPQP